MRYVFIRVVALVLISCLSIQGSVRVLIRPGVPHLPVVIRRVPAVRRSPLPTPIHRVRQQTPVAQVSTLMRKELVVYTDLSLHEASSVSEVLEVIALLKEGAQINAVDPLSGDTALHKALKSPPCQGIGVSKMHTIAALLDAGAHPRMRNHIGVMPVDLATNYQEKDLLNRS